jgi:hypothetical protein
MLSFKQIYILTFIFAAFALLACGKVQLGEGDDGTGDNGPLSPYSGTWKASCVQSEAPHGGQYYLRQQLAFSTNGFTLETEVFSESTCTDSFKKEYVLKTTGFMAFADKNEDSTLRDIDVTHSSYAIKPASVEMAKLFNDRKDCGLSTWSFDKYTNVSGKKCWNKPSFERFTLYTMVKMTNSEESALIEFAVPSKDREGTTEKKRSTSFSSPFVFKKN